MTCIVALVHENKVYMGGDAAGSDGTVLQLVSHPKVFKLGEFLIGYTSSFRMGQLLEFNLEVPASAELDDLRYMVRTFIPAVRKCLADGGFSKKNNEQEEGGTFIVGYRGKIYEVGSNYHCLLLQDKYLACGSGYTFALASIETYISQVDGWEPVKAIEEALRVAAKFNPDVRPTFTVLSL